VARYEASRNVLGVIRQGRLFGRTQTAVLRAEDILPLQMDTTTLERTIEEVSWKLQRERSATLASPLNAKTTTPAATPSSVCWTI
jgi:hypothetical protein